MTDNFRITLIKFSVFIFFFNITEAVYSQENIPKKYFDRNWSPLKSSEGASYYRIAEKKDNLFIVHDYYISGKLQMDAVCSKIEPKLTTAGRSILFYENGSKKQEGEFDNDNPVGLHTYYTEEGKLEREILHENNKEKYYAYYSEEGVNQINNGRALILKSMNGVLNHIEIEDSLVMAIYNTYRDSSDTLYLQCEHPPEYKGGFAKMKEDLSANLVYPASARRQGIEGKVFVGFNIIRSGDVKDLKVLKGISSDCDNAALHTVRQLNHWSPGIQRGRPVIFRYVLPIAFKLDR